jgi:hypothetical protein
MTFDENHLVTSSTTIRWSSRMGPWDCTRTVCTTEICRGLVVPEDAYDPENEFPSSYTVSPSEAERRPSVPIWTSRHWKVPAVAPGNGDHAVAYGSRYPRMT